MIYGFSKIYNQSKKKIEEKLFGSEYKGFDDLLAYNRVSTLTTCIRTELIKKYFEDIKPQERNWLMGDYPIWLWIGYHYKIKFLSDIMSVYRVLEESASHSKDIEKNERFVLSTIDITSFFIKKFHLSPAPLYYHALNEYYYDLFSMFKDAQNYHKARHYANIIVSKYIPSRSRKEIRKFNRKYIIFKISGLLKSRK